MANLIYIEKVPAAQQIKFAAKIIEIAAFLQINPNWLMQVMKSESGINPKMPNRSQKDNHLIAAGLIQWTKASGVPGAPESILTKDIFQQLDLVKSYFTPFRGKMKSYFDVYLVTFFPAAVGKPDSYIFQTAKYSAALIAAQNHAINRNKDNQITMAEFKQYVISTVPTAFQSIVFNIKAAVTTATGTATIVLLIATFFF